MLKELIKISNELDSRGRTVEADALDLYIKKTATPGDMYDSLEEAISKGDEVSVLDPNEVSSRLNYLGVSNEIGPMSELGGGIVRVTISGYPISKIPNVFPDPGPKPHGGFWYACGNEWLEWLKWEMPHWIGKYIYAVELNEDSILKITNQREFESFEEEFKAGGHDPYSAFSRSGVDSIDWPRVARKYAGIEICPYQSSKRNSSMWYYPWDVASGCIWSSRGIKSLRLISKTSENPSNNFPREDDPPNWDWHGFNKDK